MIGNKRKGAEKLFDAFGMIDDSIIAECQEPDISRLHNGNMSLRLRKLVSLCSVIAVIGACVSVGFLISRLSNENEDSDVNYPNYGDNMKDDIASTLRPSYQNRLDSALDKATLSVNTKSVSLDEIDFFDGKVNLIWTDAKTNGYYVLTLDENAERVKEGLKKGYSQISENGDDYARAGYTVWVSYGNGEVVSPELKYSSGNIGYNELFEYSPEVVPSEYFVNIIEKNAN